MEVATLDAIQPTATMASLVFLKEQISLLENMQAPEERLKDSYNAVEKLTLHIDQVKIE